ncbi:MAG: hypothetical protein JOS17DRAFT_780060 [Linnemannia elongata]|nr:MAG: hypothetical protein JOS17DRAFT_780060 [Linnemannia elongata]
MVPTKEIKVIVESSSPLRHQRTFHYLFFCTTTRLKVPSAHTRVIHNNNLAHASQASPLLQIQLTEQPAIAAAIVFSYKKAKNSFLSFLPTQTLFLAKLLPPIFRFLLKEKEPTMTKESQSTPPGTPQPTQAIKTSHPRKAQSASNTPFSSIERAAKEAVKPTRTLKSRSVGHGLAAIYIEQGKIASLANQGQSSPPEHDAEDKSASSPRNRKRDIIPNLIRSIIPEPKGKLQEGRPNANIRRHSTDNTNNGDRPFSSVDTDETIEVEFAVSSTVIKGRDPNVQLSVLPTRPSTDVFSQNVSAPAFQISLPKLYARVDSTPQLALCLGLLRAESGTGSQQGSFCSNATSTDAASQSDWVNAMKQDPIELDQMRSLGASMVEVFSKDVLRDSFKIAEMTERPFEIY